MILPRSSQHYLLIASLLVTTACGDATGVPDSLFLPLTDRLVFQSNQFDAYGDVFVMKTDGTDVRRLTDNTTTDLCPAVSPDGHWIAFLQGPESGHPSDASLVLMKADGTEQRVLAPGVGSRCPVWSRDSRFVGALFDSPFGDDFFRTYTVDGVLSGEFRATGVASFSYSPDGARVLEGSYLPTILTPIDFIFETVNLDGSERVRVGSGKGAVWSPLGNEIVYTACGADCRATTPPDPCTTICIVSATGAFQRDLGVSGFAPAFSPDGQTIAYRCGTTNICLIPASGGPSVEISTRALSVLTWSPTGRHIAYACGVAQSLDFDICLLDVESRAVAKLTNDQFTEQSLSFSPASTP